jgi:tRNA threonylcarbamoyladenosine biosynthesis protein TsaB
MYILNIDTSFEYCSVSVFKKGKFLNYKETKEKNDHSSQIALLTNMLLKELNITAKDLSAIAINKGPGSYTGLRIGTSFAKGICYALNIPLIAIDSLEILAKDFLLKYPNDNVDYICPMIDARRMEVYTSIFDKNLKQLFPSKPLVLDSQSFKEFQDYKIAFIGNGAAKFKFLVNHDNFYFYQNLYPNSIAIGHLSFLYYKNKKFEDIAYFEPQYLKEFIPTKPKK